MLCRLALEDFVIVERGALEFAPGLNVLTGETGAGKSILIDAIGFLAGGRASSDWIRPGAERLAVEALFDLSSAGPTSDPLPLADSAGIEIDPEGFLLLRREMGRDGRSRCFANGRQVLVSQLRGLTGGHLWIVGQGDQRALASAPEQEYVIDRFAQVLGLRRDFRERRALFLRTREELEGLAREEELFSREEEWLRAQAREIEEAGITPGERVRLREVRERLQSDREESTLREEIEGRLFREEGSILDHLESLSHLLSRAADERWQAVRDSVDSLREEARELRRILPASAAEGEENLDAIEERGLLLDRLVRKYGGGNTAAGGGEEAVLAHLAEVQRRLEAGENLAAGRERLLSDLESLRSDLGRIGEALSRSRSEAAERFHAWTRRELAALGMEEASLRFRFQTELDETGAPLAGVRVRPLENGLERVSLLFRSHPGLPEGELGKAASGGELSRVLLSVNAALGESSPPGCWVLDEVDQGIGGETANRLGDRLARMAGHAQVLLVTHLPTIAARAERHFRVVKDESGASPTARVEALAPESRVEELARMLSGDPGSAIARQHARELLSPLRPGA